MEIDKRKPENLNKRPKAPSRKISKPRLQLANQGGILQKRAQTEENVAANPRINEELSILTAQSENNTRTKEIVTSTGL